LISLKRKTAEQSEEVVKPSDQFSLLRLLRMKVFAVVKISSTGEIMTDTEMRALPMIKA